MCKLCSDRIHVHHDSSIEPQLDFKKHGDGINDPKLVEEHDLLFSGIFGSVLGAESLLEGGYTTVHNRPWNPEVVGGEIPRSYGFGREVVAGAVPFRYEATAGDVVLFNTRNPHEVAGGQVAPGGSRVSIGSFIGRMPDRRLVLWS